MSGRFSTEQKRRILFRPSGVSVTQRCRQFGIHRRTYYKWLEQENSKTKYENPRKSSQRRLSRQAQEQKLMDSFKKKKPHAKPFEIAKHLIETHSIPVARATFMAGISRRTWYRWHRIKYVTEITPELADYLRTMVYKAAEKWNIPPVYITAHLRKPPSDDARREVLLEIIGKLGLSRKFVAEIFGRDLRRVRKSVLGA